MQVFRFLCWVVVGLLLIGPTANGQQLFRAPDLSPDGSQLAFSYQGDIWTVPATGGTARRLTIHESYESQACWSPDGQHIAFVGNRYGNNDVFVTTPTGALPVRLTYHSTSDNEPTWKNNEALLFTTRRLYAQVERLSEIHAISINGGTPTRHLDALGQMMAVSADGRYIALVRGHCRVAREAYRGPANRDLWLYDTQSKTYTQLTSDEGQDILPRWSQDGRLYFLSARDGRYNLYRMHPGQSNTPTQLTQFDDMGIRHYDISDDGRRVVVEKGADIWLADTDGLAFAKVQIDITNDFRFYPTENRTLTTGIRSFDLSPNEKYVAFDVRGELFIKPNDKDKKRARNLTDHSYHDRNATWLNDSTALFLSDREGQYDLYLARSTDGAEMDLYRTFKKEAQRLTRTAGDETNFSLSPQGDKIVIQYGRGKLTAYDIDAMGKLTNETVLLDGWDSPGGVSWSPDGQWLAYSLSDLDFNEDIFIHPVDNSRAPVNVSLHPRRDANPVWSRDGSKLGFVSRRNNGDADIWFVWLREADWEKTQRDWEEDDDEPDEEKKDKKDKTDKDKKEVEPVVIDFDDIHERLVQVSRYPGNEGDLLIGPEGEYFYFSTNNGSRAGSEGDQDVIKMKWDGSDAETFLKNSRVGGLTLDAKGKNLYMVKGGKLAVTPLSKAKLETHAFEAKMKLDHRAEREQMFEEGWRALSAGFYDPEFHGRDFVALKETYRPIALAASTRQDFAMVYNEMLGQLNASHMGFRSGVSDEETQREQTGLLGVGFAKKGNQLVVDYILPDGPADRSDSRLREGDILMAINGERVTPTTNVYALLEGTANERTLLTLMRGGQTEEVVIRPTTSVSTERYEAWVDARKALTEQYSKGRLGYIHIRGMNWSSFERFERELAASGYGKDGLVIDVRFNGGGWTTDMLMTVLNVRQHAYTIPRGAAASLKENGDFRQHYPFGERLPLSAWTRPSIALCNEASYSNAEIFSHAYKHLGHGTLVGQPTFGAVISTGSQRLMDGSYVRMPFRAWYVSATQQNMEGTPATPDVIVDNPPASKAQGEDPQLRRAVEILLEEMER